MLNVLISDQHPVAPSQIEDDVAMSLLSLSKTPVNTLLSTASVQQGSSSKIDHLIGALKAEQSTDQSVSMRSADVVGLPTSNLILCCLVCV